MTEFMNPTRRGFLGLLLGAMAAPVIVKAASLMPVKPVYATGGYVDPSTRALAVNMIETKEVVASNVLRSNDWNAFREILRPGLEKIFSEAYSGTHGLYLAGPDSQRPREIQQDQRSVIRQLRRS